MEGGGLGLQQFRRVGPNIAEFLEEELPKTLLFLLAYLEEIVRFLETYTDKNPHIQQVVHTKVKILRLHFGIYGPISFDNFNFDGNSSFSQGLLKLDTFGGHIPNAVSHEHAWTCTQPLAMGNERW